MTVKTLMAPLIACVIAFAAIAEGTVVHNNGSDTLLDFEQESERAA
jgi:hypothetical protein